MNTPDEVMQIAQATLSEQAHEAFLRHLDEAKAKSQVLLDVVATPYEQAGQEVLVGSCPACRMIAALAAEGRHQCRCCHAWLRYIRKA